MAIHPTRHVRRIIRIDRRNLRPRALFALKTGRGSPEVVYGVALRKIATHVSDIIKGINDGTATSALHISDALNSYANKLGPWAYNAGNRMVTDVDEHVRIAMVQAMADAGHPLLGPPPTSQALQEALENRRRIQVELAKSLATEAAQRVRDVVQFGIQNGPAPGQTRVQHLAEISAEVNRTGPIAIRRATNIAVTEVNTANGVFTRHRAESVGSPGYTWRTQKDARVRSSHRAMEGKLIAWDSEPEVEPGKRYHAGCTFNCRCFAVPVLSGKTW